MPNLEKKLRLSYIEGYLQSLYDFAHWKDGVMYVGTTGRAYHIAASPFLQEKEALVAELSLSKEEEQKL